MQNKHIVFDSFDYLNEKIKTIYRLDINVSFSFDLKGYRLIGQCKKLSKKNYLIRLHAKLLNDFGQTYIDDVLVHELAHAVQMELYTKNKPHSKEWKNIMEKLSDNKYSTKNKIDYNLAKPQKSSNKYIYQCSCMKHFVSPLIHKRAQSQKYNYSCKKCKTPILFIEKNDSCSL